MADPLDRETSISVKLNEDGVEAKSNSRAVSGVDRLLGNLSDLLNVGMERKIAVERAKTAGQVKLIAAAAKKGAELIGQDQSFAELAIEKHLETVVRKQENMVGVTQEAIEDLRHSPPSIEERQAGPEVLSDPFLDRIEHYAGFASTDELRQRWGRVLAAEVRRPGTFTSKELRAVDELDPSTAAAFEKFCEHRIERAIPKILVPGISFMEQQRLVEAGLLVEPGLGQRLNSQELEIADTIWHVVRIGERYALGVPTTAEVPEVVLPGSEAIVRTKLAAPMVPVFLLTSVGSAIATILPNNETEALERMSREVQRSTRSRVATFEVKEGDVQILSDTPTTPDSLATLT